ncbi:MAG: NADH-quinone oxidoreductase subunit L, partial [Acidimicrobiia bacterium]
FRHAPADAHADGDEAGEHEDDAEAHAAAGDLGAQGDPHESPWTMTLPLVVLAGLALVAGALNLPFTGDLHFLGHWLEPVVEESERVVDVATGTKVLLGVLAVAAALGGIVVAGLVYLQKRLRPVEPEVLANAWYYDSSIAAFMGGPGRQAFELAADFDRTVIDGTVNGVAAGVRSGGRGLRRLQPGLLRVYALGIGVGAVVVVGYFLTRVTL